MLEPGFDVLLLPAWMGATLSCCLLQTSEGDMLLGLQCCNTQRCCIISSQQLD